MAEPSIVTSRTHPAVIREVLADVERSSPHAAARAHGIHSKTVYRWHRRRLADPSWPTDDDIALWERLSAERGKTRRRKAAMKRDYVKRRYAAQGPMMIDSLGSTRRLRALYAIGWTSTDLGPRLGFSSARVSHLVAGTRPKIHRHTAARIAAVYDELSMIVPQDPEVLAPRHIRVHHRQRIQSAAKGWLPPLAWDDIDTDPEPATGEPLCTTDGCDSPAAKRDWCGAHYKRLQLAGELPPFVRPPEDVDPIVVERVLAGRRVDAANHAERVEIVARWRAAGRPLRDLERITGWKSERYYDASTGDGGQEVA